MNSLLVRSQGGNLSVWIFYIKVSNVSVSAQVGGGDGRANGARVAASTGGEVGGVKRDRNEESRSVSDSSDSYEMIEYGLK